VSKISENLKSDKFANQITELLKQGESEELVREKWVYEFFNMAKKLKDEKDFRKVLTLMAEQLSKGYIENYRRDLIQSKAKGIVLERLIKVQQN